MAILIFDNKLLKDPEIWEMIDGYVITMEIVKQDSKITVMRVTNGEVPDGDYLVDLSIERPKGITPFISGFNVYQLYQP